MQLWAQTKPAKLATTDTTTYANLTTFNAAILLGSPTVKKITLLHTWRKIDRQQNTHVGLAGQGWIPLSEDKLLTKTGERNLFRFIARYFPQPRGVVSGRSRLDWGLLHKLQGGVLLEGLSTLKLLHLRTATLQLFFAKQSLIRHLEVKLNERCIKNRFNGTKKIHQTK